MTSDLDSQTETLASGEPPALLARHRFFLIHELVGLCLEQADTLGLINCLRVCRLWKDIIERSQSLQERLFMVPMQHVQGVTGPTRWNPILNSHFSPLLAIQTSQLAATADIVAWETDKCRYEDLERVSWARDGIDTDASARLAYSRPEASWRNMFVSQPPITSLSWFHTWVCTAGNGHGHRKYAEAITIGVLWDWLEALLLRGCCVQVTVFPQGAWPPNDPSSDEHEKASAQHPRLSSRKADFGSDVPRIRIMTHQVWSGRGPEMYQKFDIQKREWTISKELPFIPKDDKEERGYQFYNHDGYNWLIIDCQRDGDHEISNWRWSKSDAFELVPMTLVRAGRARR